MSASLSRASRVADTLCSHSGVWTSFGGRLPLLFEINMRIGCSKTIGVELAKVGESPPSPVAQSGGRSLPTFGIWIIKKLIVIVIILLDLKNRLMMISEFILCISTG